MNGQIKNSLQVLIPNWELLPPPYDEDPLSNIRPIPAILPKIKQIKNNMTNLPNIHMN